MILLTGASGYLGRHVLAILEARGLPHVATSSLGAVGVACNLLDSDATEELLKRVQPDAVIHCAALVPKRLGDYHSKAAAFDSAVMARNVTGWAPMHCPVVFADSLTSINAKSAYAIGKEFVGYMLRTEDISMMLPGLFGLPRRNGRMFNYAKDGTSFGLEPAMHVADAAEYLVRAATIPIDDEDNGEPFRVTYGNERLERVYGSLGVTFDQRVRDFVAEVQREQAQA